VTRSQHPGRLSYCYRCDTIALIVIPSPMTPKLWLKSLAAMSALSSLPFGPCDGWLVPLWHLSTGRRYTTPQARSILVAPMPAYRHAANGLADKRCRAPHCPMTRAVSPAHV
jgi:hypothetical protein